MSDSKLFEDEIRQSISGGALPQAEARIAYRQMMALENIGETLGRIEKYLRPTPNYESTSVERVLDNDPPIEVGPAVQHRRRRGAPEA